MTPTAATPTTGSLKPGMFDISTVFVADKANRDEAALNLAASTKKEGVDFLSSINFADAIIKVSSSSPKNFFVDYAAHTAIIKMAKPPEVITTLSNPSRAFLIFRRDVMFFADKRARP